MIKTSAMAAEVREIPNLDFYILSRSQGSMGCDSSLFFYVRGGVAEPAKSPGPSTENDCERGGTFATLDGTPIYIGTSYNWMPGMTATIDVSNWRGEDFQPACQIELSYRPWFSGKTLNEWGNTCEGAQCEGLHQSALKQTEKSIEHLIDTRQQRSHD